MEGLGYVTRATQLSALVLAFSVVLFAKCYHKWNERYEAFTCFSPYLIADTDSILQVQRDVQNRLSQLASFERAWLRLYGTRKDIAMPLHSLDVAQFFLFLHIPMPMPTSRTRL